MSCVLLQDALSGPLAFTAGPQQQGWGHDGGRGPWASRPDLHGPWDAGHSGWWGSWGSTPPGGCSPLSRGRQSARQDHQRGRARALLPLPHLDGMLSAVHQLTAIAHAHYLLGYTLVLCLSSPTILFCFASGCRRFLFHVAESKNVRGVNSLSEDRKETIMGKVTNKKLWLQEIMTDPVIADVSTLSQLHLLAPTCPRTVHNICPDANCICLVSL